MNKKRKAYIESCEISRLETVHLAGFDQKILIEGKRKNAPVVLFLHGGPGSPIPFSVGCRGLFPEFSDQFVMVYWDQLGCGINNRVIDDSFTVRNFVDMTADLVRYLRAEFPGNQLILFGMSWGSQLAAGAALAVPEMIDEVVIWGQVLRLPNFSEAAFDALERSAMPAKAKRELAEIRGKARWGRADAMKMSAFIRKYTEGFQAKSGEKAPMGPVIRGILTSPDYSFRDFCAIMVNGYLRNNSLIAEMLEADLSGELAQMPVPYTIFQGDKDLVTATADVVEFMKTCENPNLRLVIVPGNGHMPGKSGMDVVYAQLSGRAEAAQ